MHQRGHAGSGYGLEHADGSQDIGPPCGQGVVGGLEQPGQVDHDVGALEQRGEVIRDDIGLCPLGLRRRPCRVAAGYPDQGADLGRPAEGRQHARADIPRGSHHDDLQVARGWRHLIHLIHLLRSTGNLPSGEAVSFRRNGYPPTGVQMQPSALDELRCAVRHSEAAAREAVSLAARSSITVGETHSAASAAVSSAIVVT